MLSFTYVYFFESRLFNGLRKIQTKIIRARRGLDTAVRAAMTIGPTSRMLDGQSEAVRAAATADIRKALALHARGDGVPLGAAIWMVTATNPA